MTNAKVSADTKNVWVLSGLFKQKTSHTANSSFPLSLGYMALSTSQADSWEKSKWLIFGSEAALCLCTSLRLGGIWSIWGLFLIVMILGRGSSQIYWAEATDASEHPAMQETLCTTNCIIQNEIAKAKSLFLAKNPDAQSPSVFNYSQC